MTGPTKSRRKSENLTTVNYDPLRDIQGGRVEIFITRFGHYLRNNRTTVLLYLFLIVCIIGSSIFFKVYSNQKEEKSLIAYEALLENPLMSQPGGDIEAAIQKLEKYEKNFSSSNSSVRADIKKADLYLSAGKKKEAADSYLRLAEIVNDENLEIYFYLKAATFLEDTEQYEKALKTYISIEERFGKESGENYLRALAMFGRGRTLILLGKESEGKEALKKMMAMKEVEDIDELRILAASFLLQRKK